MAEKNKVKVYLTRSTGRLSRLTIEVLFLLQESETFLPQVSIPLYLSIYGKRGAESIPHICG